MISLKGIYHNGVIDLLEKPETEKPTEVVVLFPEIQKHISRLQGFFKGAPVDYDALDSDLSNLNRECETHILSESESING